MNEANTSAGLTGEQNQSISSTGVTDVSPPGCEPTRGLRILLAEDHPVSREAAVAVLEGLGHRVFAVNDGQEALDRLEQLGDRGVDVILMDIHMPVMGGLETTAAIRARGGSMPIIAMTADDSAQDRQRCLAAGMNHHLGKPIRARTIREVLRCCPPEDRAAGPVPAEAVTPSQEPAVDVEAALANLAGNRRILARVLARLVENVPAMLADIADAVDQGDAGRLRLAAHGMKGAAANVCAEPTRRAAERLETMGRDGELDGAKAAVTELARHAEQLSPFVARMG